MIKTCVVSGKEFEITDEDLKFYEKMGVPAPTLCPEERQLRKEQYCIFNKQYSKEDYFILRDRIIQHMKQSGEWGEFFPIKYSTFAYNKTVAHEYFPLTKENIAQRGWRWDPEDRSNFKPETYKLPDDTKDTPDTVCNETLTCEHCQKNYRIIQPELKFYRDMKLPIPRKCFLCRYHDRLQLRNPRTLFDRKCTKCQTNIQTTFAPERSEKVYCEKCYLETVN